ncbi:MAG: hypothetical protein OXE92_01595 [Bacteroidetes bacterium]|nr:hypothetical protein [Bacteroidota bacterium]MCY4204401.1 hypothetical protein [Bacteroidota bacterium]
MKTLFSFCLAALLSVPVFAQDVASTLDNEEFRWNLAVAQIEMSLDSEYQSVREQTLKNAIVIVTLYRDKINLADQSSLLRKIYQESESHRNRQLALALLQTIGGNRAQDLLARTATEAETDQVRITLASVLNDYFNTHQATTVIG